MRRYIVFSLLLVVGSANANPNTPNDKAVCRARYDEVREYLASANGFLWEMFDKRIIDYDEFQEGQYQNTLRSRNNISLIRNRAYVGTAEECEQLAIKARERINEVMEPYRQLRYGNRSPKALD